MSLARLSRAAAMNGVAAAPGRPRCAPAPRLPPDVSRSGASPLGGRRGCPKLRTRASAEDGETAEAGQDETAETSPSGSPAPTPAPPPSTSSPPEQGAPNNGLLAGGAVAAGVVLFLGTRLLGGGVTFDDLEAKAVPLDDALANGRPTVVEFYASWCEMCRDMLPVILDAEAEYNGKVNFVALNVENAKWAPEMLEYNVDGIPHYVFLDANQKPQAVGVGRLPKKVLEADLQALSTGQPLPFKKALYETSKLEAPEPGTMAGPDTMPRDHV